MADPKAERLAAIRAANAQRHLAGPPADDTATPRTSAPTIVDDETAPAASRGHSSHAATSVEAARPAPATVEATRLAPAAGGSDQEANLSIGTFGLVALSVAGGALLAVTLPALLPGLGASLVGSEPKAYWYLSRSTAFVAYILLWASMALGLTMTSKLARLWPGGPVAFDLHEHASILGLAFGLFHALILLGDRYANYSLGQILIPFASGGSEPLWVGLGQVSFYLMGIVGMSFYVRPLIGRAGWRLIHFLSFGIFGLVLLHGIQSGSDTGSVWAQGLYWLSGASLLFLTIYRVLASVMKPAASPRLATRPAPAREPIAGV